ncbi:MAG TPA: metallophosphoesterase, partial [Fimbriimonadaceae bacterium]|nr:metallophosphoesterase [Fimbriimonadaceae bacterium]
MTSASPAQKGRRRVLRLAHLTDIHVQPERGGGEGMAACLRHVHSQKDKPQLILTGGDLIMDAFDADAQRTRLQWDLFNRVLRDNTSLPVEHCIGNHDVWGWNKTKSRTTGQEPLHGKRWALEMLGLEKPYRSFDKAGWHFVVLDSTHPSETSSYTAELDDAQFEWLEDDLTKTPKTM